MERIYLPLFFFPYFNFISFLFFPAFKNLSNNFTNTVFLYFFFFFCSTRATPKRADIFDMGFKRVGCGKILGIVGRRVGKIIRWNEPGSYWRLSYATVILFLRFLFSSRHVVALKLELSKTSFTQLLSSSYTREVDIKQTPGREHFDFVVCTDG